MNTQQKKMADALADLSDAERARLERLAVLADVSAERLWPEVWEYGFDDTEESIQACIEADADFAAGRGIPHDEVMAQAARIIEDAYARRKRGAG